jgi:hypothetical protein
LDISLLALVALESVLLGLWMVKRRSVLPFAWPIAADYGMALLVLGASAFFIAPEARLSVWTMWAYPVTLSITVLVGAALPRWQHVLAGSIALAVTYATVVAVPLAHDSDGRATAVANSLAYPGFAFVAYFFTRFVRNLASAADRARQRVAELERERSRAIAHDLLPFLRLDHFADTDEQTRTLLIQQAQAKHRQMRAFVDGTDNPRDLDTHLRAVVDLHPLLATRAVFDIERQARVEPEVLEHLLRAVDTALANVAQNAPDATVVVTAVSGRQELTVTVHDDGPGFNLAEAKLGFGITQILGSQLEGVGGKGIVTSTPGKGTEVVITIPREDA